jgi:hypothetical protein
MPAKRKRTEPKKEVKRECCVCPYCDIEIIEEPLPFCSICNVEFVRCAECGLLIVEKLAVSCSRCGGTITRERKKG